MATSAERMRAWRGPAILSYGYRPFFLFAALSAAVSMIAWIFMLAGHEVLPLRIDPVSWHAHSFLFGYLWAVIAGFLMTAVPNWTGRLPIVGWSLGGLFCLWFAGRVAIGISFYLPDAVTVAVDLLFPLVLLAVIGREIIAGKNWRNLLVLVLISVLFVAQGIFDYEAFYEMSAIGGLGERLAVAVAVMLIALIGGRIVPSFTRNWLVKQHETRLPVPYNGFDKAVLLFTVMALALWVAVQYGVLTGVVALLAGALHFIRLFRWRGWLTGAEPLVWVLHLGYLFVPLGFLGVSLAAFDIAAGGLAPLQHLWMAGGIGLMTLAVMTRASLGHAGRPLTVSWPVVCLYLAVFFSVFLRLGAGVAENQAGLLHLSASLWIFAFAGFVALYWHVLTTPRLARE